MLTCFEKVCSVNELWSHKRCREKENREIINWPFSNSWLTDLVKCINNKCCMTQSSPAGARSLWSPGNVAKIKDRYFWWIHLHLNTLLPRCLSSLLTYRRSYLTAQSYFANYYIDLLHNGCNCIQRKGGLSVCRLVSFIFANIHQTFRPTITWWC